MPQGKVKWFNNAKGYGFIIANENEPEFSNEDLFAHFSSIQMEGYKTLKAGQDVTFDVIASGKGHHAVNITPIETETSAERASVSSDDNQAGQRDTDEQRPKSPRPVAAHA